MHNDSLQSGYLFPQEDTDSVMVNNNISQKFQSLRGLSGINSQPSFYAEERDHRTPRFPLQCFQDNLPDAFLDNDSLYLL